MTIEELKNAKEEVERALLTVRIEEFISELFTEGGRQQGLKMDITQYGKRLKELEKKWSITREDWVIICGLTRIYQDLLSRYIEEGSEG